MRIIKEFETSVIARRDREALFSILSCLFGREQHVISLVTRVHGSGVTIYRYIVLLGLNYKYSIQSTNAMAFQVAFEVK
jgi:hypothetical protein